MTLPNKLTLIRIVMIPIFVIIFYISPLADFDLNLGITSIPLSFLIGTIVFAIAAFTDFLDGNLARKYNLVTTFGKFLDPLADKLLVTSALLICVEFGLIPSWVAIIIISREFMVTGIRLLAMGEGKVIAASKMGKAKTISQIFMIIFLLLFPIERAGMFSYTNDVALAIILDVLVLIATLLTVVSGIDYFAKNKEIIFSSK